MPPERPTPDASMSLLSRLMDNTIDEGYAEAAERRGEKRSRPAGAGLLVGLVIVGLLLSAAVVGARERASGANVERRALVAEVERRTAKADKDAAELLGLRLEISRATKDALALSGDSGKGEALDDLEEATGGVAVRGPGVTVTLDDPKKKADTDPDAKPEPGERILDRDLQAVVNALWLAGAEAISVNDQRLTALSAIRAADVAILVDYRPLVPPYVVRAIGDPERVEAGFQASSGARDMQVLADNLGMRFDVARSDQLTLPAASGLALRSARPLARARVGQ